MAITYILDNCVGKVIIFVDNQSTLKSIFNVKPHSLFKTSRDNCRHIKTWLSKSHENQVEFRWIPSHLGFPLNELADKKAEQTPIGPLPFPSPTIASFLRQNRSDVVTQWRNKWTTFANSKALKLKINKKVVLPNAWDGKDKQFMSLAKDMSQFSRFTRLISGHAPTGEYRERFFPYEPRGCTCFARYQSHTHLLIECPKYTHKFSSIIAFNLTKNNTQKIFKYLDKNPTAFSFKDEPIDVYDPP